ALHELLAQEHLAAVAAPEAVLRERLRDGRRGQLAARHEIPEPLVEADELQRERGTQLERAAAREVRGAREVDVRVAEDGAHVLDVGGLAVDAAAQREREALRGAEGGDEARVGRVLERPGHGVVGDLEALVAARRLDLAARARTVALDERRLEAETGDERQA